MVGDPTASGEALDIGESIVYASVDAADATLISTGGKAGELLRRP